MISCVSRQELDYGALYEVRTPHFYVEANKMPTARVSAQSVCLIKSFTIGLIDSVSFEAI